MDEGVKEKGPIDPDRAELPLDERVKAFLYLQNELLIKYNLQAKVSIEFPMFKYLPPDLALAIEVINKYDRRFPITYTDKGGEK